MYEYIRKITVRPTALFLMVVTLFCMVSIFQMNVGGAKPIENDMTPGDGDHIEGYVEEQANTDTRNDIFILIFVVGILVEIFFMVRWIVNKKLEKLSDENEGLIP
jgi:quinol-cytochrome oxidoreductase complex cytochrome b subunit